MTYETQAAALGRTADEQIASLTGSLAQETTRSADLASALATSQSARLTAEARVRELEQLLAAAQPPAPVGPAVPAGWRTAFLDEFKAPTLDTKAWTANTGTLGAPREEYNRPENVTTGKGLVITAKREPFGGRAVTSGYITSAGKVEFGIGSLFEAEITMPKMSANAAGLWPAFWLRFANVAGELDILEAYGAPFKTAASAAAQALMRGGYEATTHNTTQGSPAKTVLASGGGVIADGSTHRYGLAFEETGLTYLFDGKPLADTYGRPNPITWEQLAAKGVLKSSFAGKAHMRLQLQVGSPYWGPSTPDTALPAAMRVNWVRVLTKA
jgi:beta-glucanase (GH16 family)